MFQSAQDMINAGWVWQKNDRGREPKKRQMVRLEKGGSSRTNMQTPISAPMYRVLYLVNKKEKQSPWLYRLENAKAALAMMQAKYGQRNAIIYVD
jgi:hypothetical protein